MKIQFKTTVSVILNDKKIGEIREVPGGYSYFPKGQKHGGDVFKTLEAAKASLY